MMIHLREFHREELAKDLPLRGKGFDMNCRIGFAIDIMKHEIPEFYDHKYCRIRAYEEVNCFCVKSDYFE